MRIKKIQINSSPSIQLYRNKTIDEMNLVYITVSDKIYTYPDKNSRIVYIGLTAKQGIRRIAHSIAMRHVKKSHLLKNTKFLSTHAIYSKEIKGEKEWKDLERAFIIAFRDNYAGDIPLLNTQGKRFKKGANYFDVNKINKIFKRIENIYDLNNK